jgi:hypothetical protein
MKAKASPPHRPTNPEYDVAWKQLLEAGDTAKARKEIEDQYIEKLESRVTHAMTESRATGRPSTA